MFTLYFYSYFHHRMRRVGLTCLHYICNQWNRQWEKIMKGYLYIFENKNRILVRIGHRVLRLGISIMREKNQLFYIPHAMHTHTQMTSFPHFVNAIQLFNNSMVPLEKAFGEKICRCFWQTLRIPVFKRTYSDEIHLICFPVENMTDISSLSLCGKKPFYYYIYMYVRVFLILFFALHIFVWLRLFHQKILEWNKCYFPVPFA